MLRILLTSLACCLVFTAGTARAEEAKKKLEAVKKQAAELQKKLANPGIYGPGPYWPGAGTQGLFPRVRSCLPERSGPFQSRASRSS